MLEPVWACGHVIPGSLVYYLETGDLEEEEEKQKNDDEFDFDDFSELNDDLTIIILKLLRG